MRPLPLCLLAFAALSTSLALGCSATPESDEELEEGAAEGALTSSDLDALGHSQMKFPIEGRPDERCIIPKKLGGSYTEKDLLDEKRLCSVNFHASSPGVAGAICPKNNSTNPGIYVNFTDGKTKQEVEAGGCRSTPVGTFKQSVTCSYTGSIIGYYHLSRFLGGAVNVPVSVGRTMDLEKHKEIVPRGKAASEQFKGGGFDIYESWEQFEGWDRNPSKAPRSGDVYTSDFQQLYGALQDKVAAEGKHPRLGRTPGGAAGLNAFMALEPFQIIAGSTPLEVVFPGETADSISQASLQGLIDSKDITDMILMDELMAQNDRYGNISSWAYRVYPEGGTLKKVLLERTGKDGLEIKNDRAELGGHVVHEMLLRDNDCGVSKTNIAAQANGGAGVVVKFAHMSSRTYKHFQWLAQEIVKPGSAVQVALAKESFIGAPHFQKIVSQATKLAKTLRTRCESGALALDADLRDRLEGKKVGKEACALAEPPPPAQGTVDSHGIELVTR